MSYHDVQDSEGTILDLEEWDANLFIVEGIYPSRPTLSRPRGYLAVERVPTGQISTHGCSTKSMCNVLLMRAMVSTFERYVEVYPHRENQGI